MRRRRRAGRCKVSFIPSPLALWTEECEASNPLLLAVESVQTRNSTLVFEALDKNRSRSRRSTKLFRYGKGVGGDWRETEEEKIEVFDEGQSNSSAFPFTKTENSTPTPTKPKPKPTLSAILQADAQHKMSSIVSTLHTTHEFIQSRTEQAKALQSLSVDVASKLHYTEVSE